MHDTPRRGSVTGELRFTRRSVLTAFVSGGAGLLGASLLAACQPAAPPATNPTGAPKPAAAATTAPAAPAATTAPAAAQSAAKTGGTFRVPIPTDPGMNPVAFSEEASVKINKVLFLTLTRPDESFTPTPYLAQSWESTPDGLVWTFKLRDKVQWHDGKPLTSADVQYTFEQIINPASGSRWVANFTDIDRVEAPDPTTVVFRMKRPNAAFPALAAFNAGIIPKHILEGKELPKETDFNTRKPVGAGPFRVREVVPGDRIVLEAFPEFFLGRPKLDTMVFKVIGDINAAVAQAKAGELDFVPIEPANLPAIQGDQRLKVVEGNVAATVHINLNNKGLFSDPKLRQAMVYALDREGIVKSVMQGRAQLATGPIPTTFDLVKDPGAKALPYDVEKAKALFGETGWRPGPDGMLQKDGKSFKFDLVVDKTNPARVQAATVAQQLYKRAGLDATLQVLEWSNYVDRLLKKDFEAMVGFWNWPTDPDPSTFYGEGGGFNVTQYSNAKALELTKQARQEMDRNKRKELYAQLNRVYEEDPPAVIMYYPKELAAVDARVQGLTLIGMRDGLLWSEKIAVG